MVNLFRMSFFERTLIPLYDSYSSQTYFGILLFLLLAAALCSILATLAYLFSLSPFQDSEKRSEYECGFEPFDNATRLPFDVHFYLVGILFLIFDVEIALFFPWVLSLRTAGWFGFYLIIAFVVILAIGFAYEWKRGALIWPSRQTELAYTAVGGNKRSFRSIVVPTIFLTPEISYAEQFFGGLLPEVFFVLAISTVLTLIAVELGRGQNKQNLTLNTLSSLKTTFLLVAALYVIQGGCGTSLILFHGYAISTSYTSFIKVLVVLSCWFILANSEGYIKSDDRVVLEYPIILSLATLFILLIVSAAHLVSAFIALVGFSLNLYVLILSDAPTFVAREAGVKYFYLSTISSGFILYGVFLILFVAGTGQFFELGQCFSTETETVASGRILLYAAALLLLAGLFFKLSSFPGHLWAADVYEGSPDTITAFFILPVKVTVLAFAVQFFLVAFEPVSSIWQPIIIVGAVGSLIWGCFAALSERKTKRFLAFASINQIGFILIGLASGSFEGYRTTIFYLIIYTIINIVFLAVFLQARRHDGVSLLYLTDFRGFGQKYPQYSWSITVVLLSIAGIPPLAGFFGKYYLLLHAQEQGLYVLVICALFTSLVSAYYYLRIIKIIWFEGNIRSTPIYCELPVNRVVLMRVTEWALWSVVVLAGPILELIEILLETAIISFIIKTRSQPTKKHVK